MIFVWLFRSCTNTCLWIDILLFRAERSIHYSVPKVASPLDPVSVPYQHCVWGLQKRELNTWNWLHRLYNRWEVKQRMMRQPRREQQRKAITSLLWRVKGKSWGPVSPEGSRSRSGSVQWDLSSIETELQSEILPLKYLSRAFHWPSTGRYPQTWDAAWAGGLSHDTEKNRGMICEGKLTEDGHRHIYKCPILFHCSTIL